MKTRKGLLFLGGIAIAMLLYVFGSMYMSNKDQTGGNSGSNTTSSNTQAKNNGATTYTSPPGNTSTSMQQETENQTANPTVAAQSPLFQGTAQLYTQPIPTQPIQSTQTTKSSNSYPGNSNANTIQRAPSTNSTNNPLQTQPTTFPVAQ